MRVYPRTPLADLLEPEAKVSPVGRGDLVNPTYHFGAELGEDPLGVVRQAVGDDPRFLLLAGPEDERNYNYVGDDWLERAIAEGARGAYWDILRGKG